MNMSDSIFKSSKKEEPKKTIAKPVHVYDLSDFREVRDLYIETKDKSKSDFVKLCYSTHSWDRINNEYERFCPPEIIDEIFTFFADRAIRFPFDDDFSLTDHDSKVCIHGYKTKINGNTAFVIKTVIRNFSTKFDGKEIVDDVQDLGRIRYRNKRM